MSLKQQLAQTLSGLSLFSSGVQSLNLSEAQQELSCELAALDTLACSFTKLTLRASSLTNKSADELKSIAEALSAKLTYLLEPISPIETDSTGCTVQMRSNPPQKEADRTSYYELLVARAGELSLVRYSRAVGSSRGIVPAHVTREVLCRLVGDLSDAAS
jgi:hypothetical protein